MCSDAGTARLCPACRLSPWNMVWATDRPLPQVTPADLSILQTAPWGQWEALSLSHVLNTFPWEFPPFLQFFSFPKAESRAVSVWPYDDHYW